jgi:hypothetical protein
VKGDSAAPLSPFVFRLTLSIDYLPVQACGFSPASFGDTINFLVVMLLGTLASIFLKRS